MAGWPAKMEKLNDKLVGRRAPSPVREGTAGKARTSCVATPKAAEKWTAAMAPAAKRRKNLAHGVSRGLKVEPDQAPTGRKKSCGADSRTPGASQGRNRVAGTFVSTLSQFPLD